MFPSRLRNAEPWDFVLWFKYRKLTKLQAQWHSDTSMAITNLSGIKDSIHDRQINQVEKHNDEERKMVDF